MFDNPNFFPFMKPDINVWENQSSMHLRPFPPCSQGNRVSNLVDFVPWSWNKLLFLFIQAQLSHLLETLPSSSRSSYIWLSDVLLKYTSANLMTGQDLSELSPCDTNSWLVLGPEVCPANAPGEPASLDHLSHRLCLSHSVFFLVIVTPQLWGLPSNTTFLQKIFPIFNTMQIIFLLPSTSAPL